MGLVGGGGVGLWGGLGTDGAGGIEDGDWGLGLESGVPGGMR